MSGGVMESWRDEDAAKRRCEVTVYSTDVGEPGSGPEPFSTLMDTIAPAGWRWIAVQFIEANEKHVRGQALDGNVPENAQTLDEALARLQSEVHDARELLRDGAITTEDDVPNLYSVGRAWIDADRAWHKLLDAVGPGEEDDDDDDD